MAERSFLKTGIPGFDSLLNIGIPRGSTVTVSGSTGSGKSTFAMQFLIEGIKKFKEPGLYISMEESRASAHLHFSSYTWSLEKLEKAAQLVFLDYPIYEVDQFLGANNAIQEIITHTGVKRVVLDSIMPVALYFNNDEERKKGFLKLLESIRRWNTTTFIVSEDAPSTTQDILPDTHYGIETLSEGWIHLYYLYSQKSKERTRALEILKMKGTEHSRKIHLFNITEEGISIK